jgi:nucleoside-diphosphate-sugar epimerase
MDADIEVMEEPERLRPEASEVMRLICDSRRLTEATGWRASCTLEDGLASTIAWFGDPDNLARYKVGMFNL